MCVCANSKRHRMLCQDDLQTCCCDRHWPAYRHGEVPSIQTEAISAGRHARVWTCNTAIIAGLIIGMYTAVVTVGKLTQTTFALAVTTFCVVTGLLIAYPICPKRTIFGWIEYRSSTAYACCCCRRDPNHVLGEACCCCDPHDEDCYDGGGCFATRFFWMDFSRRMLLLAGALIFLVGYGTLGSCVLFRQPLVSHREELAQTEWMTFVISENACVVMTDGQNVGASDIHPIVPVNWNKTEMPSLWLTSLPNTWNLNSGRLDQETIANPWPIKVSKIPARSTVWQAIYDFSATRGWKQIHNNTLLLEVQDTAASCDSSSESIYQRVTVAGLFILIGVLVAFNLPIACVFSCWHIDRDKYQQLPPEVIEMHEGPNVSGTPTTTPAVVAVDAPTNAAATSSTAVTLAAAPTVIADELESIPVQSTKVVHVDL